MRIFSSAEYRRRVARRMSLTNFSAGSLVLPDFCLFFAHGYDDPEIFLCSIPTICLMGADAAHPFHSPRTTATTPTHKMAL